MFITATALAALRTGYRNDFNEGLTGVTPDWDKIATRIPSTTKSNTYGWLSSWPRLREWIGDRQVKSLSESSYTVVNKPFESTVGVPRTAIEDDEFGVYGPMMKEMGQAAAEHPDDEVFSLLAAGFTTACYDGQNFFDDEHPLGDTGDTWSNVQTGVGEAWFLLDTSRSLKPLIFQERKKPEFVSLTEATSPNVFMAGEYVYGVDLRGAAGFGFPQLAFGSKAPLTKENYEAAYEAMTSQKTDDGRPLKVRPTILVHGPQNRAAAKELFESIVVDGGGTNVYFKDVSTLLSQWVG